MLSNGLILQDGRFISQHHQNIAQMIYDYDQSLSLVWIPDTERNTEHDKKYPFAILCTPETGDPYLVFKLGEDEVDQRLLARIWAWDKTRHNIVDQMDMSYIQDQENIVKRSKAMEEERKKMGLDILNSPKHSYKHNGVRFD